MEPPSTYFDGRHKAIALGLLVAAFLLFNCLSLLAIERSVGVVHGPLSEAIVSGCLAALLIPLFVFCRFSFGYVVGVSFYGVIAGFIWISYFSNLHYDHHLARLSAIASFVMFVLPVLVQRRPLRSAVILSSQAMAMLLVAVLCLTVVVLVLDARYGVAFVGIDEAADLRARFSRPAVLDYLTGALIGGALPFSFAYFARQRRYALSALSIGLIVLFYPVLLNKTVLLAAIWLPFLYWVFHVIEPRQAAVLTRLAPLVAGLVVYAVLGPGSPISKYVFGWINIRTFALPSIAMDYYSEFFANHELTRFCQINIVRVALGCSYAEQPGPLLAAQYGLGNLNASLFSTEGIASVGPVWAPVSAFVCGLIVSLGNSVSTRHSPALVAASSGLVVQSLLNVPLSITLLSNGFLVLMLLWYVAPATASEDRPA
jgi:hypothetical protein